MRLVEMISWERTSIVERRFNEVGHFIASFVDHDRGSLVELVTVFRGAFAARRMIPGWNDLVNRAGDSIRRRWPDRNPDTLLSGLLSPVKMRPRPSSD